MNDRAPLFHDRPPPLGRGACVPARDGAGRPHPDACNDAPPVGHCHPRALTTRHLDERIRDDAEAMRAPFDESLSRVVLRRPGAEAGARMPGIARASTGNDGVIATDFRHHGNPATSAALSTAFAAPAALP